MKAGRKPVSFGCFGSDSLTYFFVWLRVTVNRACAPLGTVRLGFSASPTATPTCNHIKTTHRLRRYANLPVPCRGRHTMRSLTLRVIRSDYIEENTHPSCSRTQEKSLMGRLRQPLPNIYPWALGLASNGSQFDRLELLSRGEVHGLGRGNIVVIALVRTL